jgi:hypothetical protein
VTETGAAGRRRHVIKKKPRRAGLLLALNLIGVPQRSFVIIVDLPVIRPIGPVPFL